MTKHTRTSRWTLAVAATLAATVSFGAGAAEPTGFETADAAAQALVDALGREDAAALTALFGENHAAAMVGGDPIAARADWRRAHAAAQERLSLRPDGDSRATVVIGHQAWPLPIPLVRAGGVWRFDAEQGLEELLNRRIGRNELAVIDAVRAYEQAQMLYSAEDRDGDGVKEYATKLGSSPGRRDGLYWPAADTDPPSPLASFAAASMEYLEGRTADAPFRGYHYRILTRQGVNAPGGSHDYVINGNMIAGFALIAWPAEYRNTGVMTFLISRNGQVLEKDLGPATEQLAAAIEAYDPDETWAPATD